MGHVWTRGSPADEHAVLCARPTTMCRRSDRRKKPPRRLLDVEAETALYRQNRLLPGAMACPSDHACCSQAIRVSLYPMRPGRGTHHLLRSNVLDENGMSSGLPLCSLQRTPPIPLVHGDHAYRRYLFHASAEDLGRARPGMVQWKRSTSPPATSKPGEGDERCPLISSCSLYFHALAPFYTTPRLMNETAHEAH